MNNKKYQVFISSTYLDLIEERKSVHDALLLAGYLPVEMENFGSAGMNQTDYINGLLDQTDYYVLIIAGKYGSLNKDGISYTEAEYEYAVDKGIPVLPFVYKDINKLALEKSETESDRIEKLKKFRDKVSASVLVSFYDSKEKLASQVLASLDKAISNMERPGWIRADAANISTDHTGPKEKPDGLCAAMDPNLTAFIKAFQPIATKTDILNYLYRGMTEKNIDGSMYWNEAKRKYTECLNEIKNAYEGIRFTIMSDELFNRLTDLKVTAERALFVACDYRMQFIMYLQTSDNSVLNEEIFIEYEKHMREIPEKYNKIAEFIRNELKGTKEEKKKVLTPASTGDSDDEAKKSDYESMLGLATEVLEFVKTALDDYDISFEMAVYNVPYIIRFSEKANAYKDRVQEMKDGKNAFLEYHSVYASMLNVIHTLGKAENIISGYKEFLLANRTLPTPPDGGLKFHIALQEIEEDTGKLVDNLKHYGC